MTDTQQVEKPKKRSVLRKFLGKEFFIAKRQFKWMFGGNNFARVDLGIKYDNSLIIHKSLSNIYLPLFLNLTQHLAHMAKSI